MDKEHRINKIISSITSSLGSVPAIIASTALILGWAVSGPIFGFSETWQLWINTGTTIITFLMVFVIQNSQNRDGRAIQTKLDAIIEALDEIQDEDLLEIEEQTEKEIKDKQREIIEKSKGA